MSERADQRKRLPAGTVTFLFADIEGSTHMLTALGDRFGVVRARSRELVRAACSRFGGHEVDWAGDGVFLAFERARDAVAAAAELQRALAEEPWGPRETVRFRIGIHTGEPKLDGEGYVGMDVVVAARICSAAHGGQVVISRATRELVGEAPLTGTSLRPLGEHRLKDVPEPEPLFQLVGPGLADAFPPLSTLGGATLPTLHHRLVGRAVQVEAIQTLLARPGVRLVTITGPGGTGKSRLALEVAAEAAVRRPVHLVGLASISDPALVPAAIARTLGVRESPERPLVTSIADALKGTRALLYLDNFEHLAPAVEHVRALLDAVADLDVLVTSRAALRLSDEHVLPLDPLPVHEAVELFQELAASRGVALRDGTRPTISEICRRLDCLPLAIELVAARLTFLSPSQLLQALEGSAALDLPGPVDLPERQRTLRATLDWSYGLLTGGQQALHGALAVFAGGCTLEDARAVAGAPSTFLADLEALVLGSLVRGSAAGEEVRLAMLETVREHVFARLESEGALEELRGRHAELFLSLALSADEGLAGSEQASWAERLERDLDNLRTALDWLVTSGRTEDALRATCALERFWRAKAHLTEARRRLEFGLELSEALPADARALGLRSAAHMAMGQSDWDAAVPLLEEAIALFRESGNAYDEVVALGYLSFVELRRNDVDRAERLGLAAVEVARGIGDDRAVAVALMALGDIAWVKGDHDRSLAQYDEAVALSRRAGDPLLVVDAVYNLGMAAFQGGDRERAGRAFEEALQLASELRDAPHTAAVQFMLAELAALNGDLAAAGEHALESLALYTDLEDERSQARCLVIAAAAAAARGSFTDAARLLGAADAARGADQPDAFERPILERLELELREALDERDVVSIRSEGARLGGAVARELVAAGAKE